MKKYILFDLDGTLTDPMIGITMAAKCGLEHMGIPVEDHKTLTFFIGPPLKATYMDHYGMREEEAQEAIRAFRTYFEPIGIFQNEIYPGIREMLEALQEAGKVLMMATSKPEAFAEEILSYFHIRDYFTFVAGSTMEETRSGKDEVIAHLLQEQQLENPNEIIMVGDRCYDVDGAKVFGIDCVGVTYGYGGREELEASGAAYVVDTVEALKKLLLAL